MASLLETPFSSPHSLFNSHSHSSHPQSHNKPFHLPILRSSTTGGAVDPSPPPPLSNQDEISVDGSSKDRRKVVKFAWEKLVRWSRSWRSKAKTDVLERTNKVVVLGGGSFGTAMAAHVANRKAELEVNMLVRDHRVCESINENHCNCKYFPEHKLPENIIATTDAKAALLGADFCFHAVPVQFSSVFLEDIAMHVDPSLPFISLSKGLELNTLRTMSQIIPRALRSPRQPYVVLSGPSFALELMNTLPTAMVVASKDKKVANAVQQLLASRNLRINTSRCTEECTSNSSWYCGRIESREQLHGCSCSTRVL
nr:glycerol-3-phosphate dehydrogenase [NAD(+)] 2, chloroplastic [Ipomoea batatas]